MDLLTQDKIIKGFKENDCSLISEVYKTCYPIVEKFILYNTGSEEDAKDILQDALMVVFQKIREGDFELSSSISTYIYSIIKNMWLKELRSKRNNGVIVKDLEEFEDVDFYISFEKEYQFNIEYFIFRKHYLLLGKICKQVLRMFLEKISYEEIAQILNMSTEGVARRRKFRCKEILVKSIKKDPDYLKIINNDGSNKTK